MMPVLEGKSLEQRVRQQGILTVTETLRVGRQIALGLAAAHAQGLVHRDVKPANILLHNGVERVVITDFGLARAIDDASLTQSGTVVGTPQYMSPEQAKGGHVDARGDLFSLGSVLYCMLCGHSPFRAETTMGVLHRIVNDTPRPLRQINPEVLPWLEQIIGRLLKKDPADRYESAAEVAELLGMWLAHLQDPTTSPRPSEPQEEAQPVVSGSRSRFVKVLLGLLGGAATLLAGIFVVLETGKGTLTRAGQEVVRLVQRSDVESGDTIDGGASLGGPENPFVAPLIPPKADPLRGYWTAVSEIGDGPWQVKDGPSHIRLVILDEIFGLQQVDAEQQTQHQVWGEITWLKKDQERSGEMEVHFRDGDKSPKTLKAVYRVAENDLAIEILSSDPPSLFGKHASGTWVFRRGIKVPDLLIEGEFGYADMSFEDDFTSAYFDHKENAFAVYSRKRKAWGRYRFPQGMKFREMVYDVLSVGPVGKIMRSSFFGFNLSGKPVDELIAVDTQGRIHGFPLDKPIDEELVQLDMGRNLYYAANEHVYAFSEITGTWDALSVPGMPTAVRSGRTIDSPIKNYSNRPDIVVALPHEIAVFAADVGKWERLSYDQAVKDPRFEDFKHDLKMFEPGF